VVEGGDGERCQGGGEREVVSWLKGWCFRDELQRV
jgi:hypothetical protein